MSTSIEQSLYEGRLIRLGPLDHEKDPAVESAWTHDSEFLRLTAVWPAWPLSPERIKKGYEALEKDAEARNSYPSRVRLRSDDPAQNDRLLGFAQLERIDWSNGNSSLRLAIGDPADRGKGYGTEALKLLLRIAFDDLNLHRVTARVPGYNAEALAFLARRGFVEEVRRRQALRRDAQLWDEVILGILRDEWVSRRSAKVGS